MRRARIYIAGPMSLGDKVDNLGQALKAYRLLAEFGYAPMCPQLTFFAEPFIPLEHSDWLSIDLPWVECADAVLRLPGQSAGAKLEVAHAKEHGIPVFYSPNLLFDRIPSTIE